MKRYKLLKDLPDAKTGDIFQRKTDDVTLVDIIYKIDSEEIALAPTYHIEDITNFNEWFEEIEEMEWRPRTTDKYWLVNTFGQVDFDFWDGGCIDNARYEIGNCYRTEKEAEHAKKVQIARTKIRRSSNFVPNWDNKCQEKFFVYLNHFAKYLDVGNTVSYNTIGQIVFYPTRKDAERAIEELRQDYFLHFGVEK